VLDGDDVLPPVVPDAAELFPALCDHFIERILGQAAEIGGGGALGALGMKAAMQVIITVNSM